MTEPSSAEIFVLISHLRRILPDSDFSLLQRIATRVTITDVDNWLLNGRQGPDPRGPCPPGFRYFYSFYHQRWQPF